MDALIGSEIAGYRIEALLGRGAVGVVYLAEQSFPRRKVALKILAPELADDPAFRERFERESETAASLDHPNIVPIYGAGEADGHLFIAMRYVEGMDLATTIAMGGPLDPARAAGIVGQVASALDAAHRRGLVHRDVKPGNILLTGPRGEELAYLTDFGVTRRLQGDTRFTRTGQFVGTVDYVAPEEIKGESVDERTDVYSLGAVLYQCLTGVPPFDREVEAAVLYAHLQDPPPLPSERRPELPSAIDAVIGTAMAKAPADRYRSAGELAAAAKAVLMSPERVESPPTQRRGRTPIVLVSVLVAAVVAGALVFALTRPSPPTGSRGAGSPSVAASPSAGFALFTIADREPTADEQRLLGFVPPRLASGCGPLDRKTETALGSVGCLDADQQVVYSLFSSRSAMDQVFDRAATATSVAPGDCATEHQAVERYGVDGTTAGRVLCFLSGVRSEIVWTDERVLVMGTAMRNDLGDLSLYQWWTTEAGPVDPSSENPSAVKDVPGAPTPAPVGTYATQITAVDAKGPDLRFVANKVAGTEFPFWDGIWTLELSDSRWSLAHLGERVEDGTYALAKGHQVVFAADSGPCAGAPPAAYAYATSRAEVEWTEAPSAGGECLPGPRPVNLHGWVGPTTRIDLVPLDCSEPGVRCRNTPGYDRYEGPVADPEGRSRGRFRATCSYLGGALQRCSTVVTLDGGSVGSSWLYHPLGIHGDPTVQAAFRITAGTGAYAGADGYGWFGSDDTPRLTVYVAGGPSRR